MNRHITSILYLSLLLSTGVFLASCSDSDGTSGNTGLVRFVNVVVDAGRVDFTKDKSDVVAEDVAYLEGTDYMEISADSHLFSVSLSESFVEIASRSTGVSTDADYTLVASGSVSDGELTVLRDDNSEPPSDQARIRLMNAVDGKTKVDAFIVPVGGDYPSAPADSDMSYKTVSKYINGDTGTFVFEFRNSRTNELIARSASVEIEEGQVRTVILSGNEDGYGVVILTDRD